MFIWRSLLKLPENHAAYSSLVDKGTHNAFARLHEEYPIKSRKLLRVLQRLVIRINCGEQLCVQAILPTEKTACIHKKVTKKRFNCMLRKCAYQKAFLDKTKTKAHKRNLRLLWFKNCLLVILILSYVKVLIECRLLIDTVS